MTQIGEYIFLFPIGSKLRLAPCLCASVVHLLFLILILKILDLSTQVGNPPVQVRQFPGLLANQIHHPVEQRDRHLPVLIQRRAYFFRRGLDRLCVGVHRLPAGVTK